MAAPSADILSSLSQDARNKELFSAISEGKYDAVKKLVQAGVDIEARDKDGYSFLMLAAHNGHLPIVKYLVSAGANINSDVNLLDYEESNYALTESEHFADTPLSLASENGHFQIVEYLVTAGADVNFSNGFSDQNPLCKAAENGHATIVKYLLEAGADIINNDDYDEDDDDCPALMAALRNKHKSVIEVLLTYADIDIGVNELTRAFINAAMSNSVEIVLLFLQHHATTTKLPDEVIRYISMVIFKHPYFTIAHAAQVCVNFLAKYKLVLSDSGNDELTKKTYRIRVRSSTEQLYEIDINWGVSNEVKTGLDWKWQSSRSSVHRSTLLRMINQYGIAETIALSNYLTNQGVKRSIAVNLTQIYPLLQLIIEDEIAAPYIIVNLFKAIFTSNLEMATDTAQNERRLNFLKLLSEKYNYLDLNALITAGFTRNAAYDIRAVALQLQSKALEMVRILNKVFDRNCTLSNQLILQYAGDLPDPYLSLVRDVVVYPAPAASQSEIEAAAAATQDISASLPQFEKYKALFSAIKHGNYDAVKSLVQAGVDIEARDYDGYSFLMLAAQNGNLPIVKYLVSAGANINSDANLVNYLDYEEPNYSLPESDHFEDTPLALASENGHFQIVEYLVTVGADVNFCNAFSYYDNAVCKAAEKSALCKAAENGHATIVKYLLDAGAVIINNDAYNSRYDDVCPALIQAVKGKHKSVIEVLLTYAYNHIDVNELTRAFVNAAMSNSVEIVLLFLQHHVTKEKLPDEVIRYISMVIFKSPYFTIAHAAQDCVNFLAKYDLVLSDSGNDELTKKNYRIQVRSSTEQLYQIDVSWSVTNAVKTGLDWKLQSTTSSWHTGTLLPMINQYGISDTMLLSNYETTHQDIKRDIEVNLTQTYPLLQLITGDKIAAPYIIINLFKAIFTTNLDMTTETAQNERRVNFLKLLSKKYNYLDLNALITAGFPENTAKAIRDVALTLQNQALKMVQIINKYFNQNCALSNQLILQYAGDLPDPYTILIRDAAAYPGAAAGHSSETGAAAAAAADYSTAGAAAVAGHSEDGGAAASAITSVAERSLVVPGHQVMQLAVSNRQNALTAARPVRSGKAEAIEEDMPEINRNLTTQSTNIAIAEPVRSGLAFLPMLNLAQERGDAANSGIAQQRKRRSAELANTASTGASAGLEQQIPAPNKLQNCKKLV